MKQYQLVLLNDESHTYSYVVTLLIEVFDYSKEMAFELTKKIDQEGKAVIYTGPYEYAEFKRDKILDFGPDMEIPECAGSMICVMEPA